MQVTTSLAWSTGISLDRQTHLSLEGLSARRAERPVDSLDYAWVDLLDPSPDELSTTAHAFGLDQLQVEDAANPHQRAKFEFDGKGTVFGLLKVLDYVPGTSDVVTGQVAIFVGPGYAITVRHGDTTSLEGVTSRLEGSPNLRAHGPYGLLYALVDSVVDAYVAVVEELTVDVEDLENQVFTGGPSTVSSRAIYNLKRENQEVRRAVAPLIPSAHQFVGHDIVDVPADMRQNFRDIGEHVLRVGDTVDSIDSLLLTLLMAQTALQDLQQNRDMRKISAWVAIAAVPTAVAGIYGMNFDTMPELHWTFGYPLVLGLTATACLLLYRAFKRSGWL